MKNKPLLQIALDDLSIEQALLNLEKIKDHIDVIEIGTILIAAQGKKAIEVIAKKYPNKIIIADGKIADAGVIFGKMFIESGADFLTCICAAESATIAKTLKTAKSYGQDKDVQIELTSHFTWKQVQEWKNIGVSQVVYHRSRDAQASGVKWSFKDLANIKKLMSMGFKVTVTGGITIEDIAFFKDLPIYIFIVGRAIRNAKDPKLAAATFQQAIAQHYG